MLPEGCFTTFPRVWRHKVDYFPSQDVTREKYYSNQCFLQGIKPKLCYFFPIKQQTKTMFFFCNLSSWHHCSLLSSLPLAILSQSACPPVWLAMSCGAFPPAEQSFCCHHSRCSQLPLCQIQQSSRLKRKRQKNSKLVGAVVERRCAKKLLQYLCSSLTCSICPMFGAN